MATRPGRSTTDGSSKPCAPSYRTIVPDHMGCGLSDKPDDARYDYTLASRIADLEGLLDHLGLDARDHPGRTRLGRGDRPGICHSASRAGRAAGRAEHGGVPPAQDQGVSLAALALPEHAAGRLPGPRSERRSAAAPRGSAVPVGRSTATSATPTVPLTIHGPLGSPFTDSYRTSRSDPATGRIDQITRIETGLSRARWRARPGSAGA